MPRHQPKTYAPRAFKRIFFLAFTLLAVSGLIPVAIKVGEQLRSKTAVGEVVEGSPITTARTGRVKPLTISWAS